MAYKIILVKHYIVWQHIIMVSQNGFVKPYKGGSPLIMPPQMILVSIILVGHIILGLFKIILS